MTEILFPDVTAWLRCADATGLDLPQAISEARSNLESLEAGIAALPALEKVPVTAKLAASGMTLDKAAEENARLTEEMARRASAHEAARPALHIARRTLNMLMAEHRDDLILGVRSIVTDLIGEARPLAKALEEFAPSYNPTAIVKRGKPAHMKAFQESVALEEKLGTCLAAWRASFKAGTKAGGYPSPGDVPSFDPRWVKQVHRYWRVPELVDNARLNGTHRDVRGRETVISPTVLAVACEPDAAGFRLATFAELKDAYDAEQWAHLNEAREAIGLRRRGRGMAV